MQAASTEFVVDGVEPRGTLPLPPRMPSSPSVPSRAPNLLLPPTGVVFLVRTIGADAPLRPFLRRGFDGVVQSAMPCARASGGCVIVGAPRVHRSVRGAPKGRAPPLETP